MCVGCRRRAVQTELIRVVRAADGSLVVGRPGRGGRGAWLGPECIETVGSGELSRALRAPVTGADVDALRTALSGRGRIEVRRSTRGDTIGRM